MQIRRTTTPFWTIRSWPYERQWMKKGREGGMPEEDYWNSFFDTVSVVGKLFGAEGRHGSLVGFGMVATP
jgi:hypothetical protein